MAERLFCHHPRCIKSWIPCQPAFRAESKVTWLKSRWAHQERIQTRLMRNFLPVQETRAEIPKLIQMGIFLNWMSMNRKFLFPAVDIMFIQHAVWRRWSVFHENLNERISAAFNRHPGSAIRQVADRYPGRDFDAIRRKTPGAV